MPEPTPSHATRLPAVSSNVEQPKAAPPDAERAAMRQRLLLARRTWADSPAFAPAQQQVHAQLMRALAQLEPDCLGVYWPLAGEFNPLEAASQAKSMWGCQLALPFAYKAPREMKFLSWNGHTPSQQDECGIPTGVGEPVLPDVVLVPCVGFTAEGFRLGYGGGYFDRYLAAHPHITAVGLGWEIGRLSHSELKPLAHDQPLVGVITEAHG